MEKLKAHEMGRLTPQEYNTANKTPLIVVADNIRSMHNIGAIFRTSDAFRLQSVYLCGISCCPPNNEIHKTALGAEQTVDWQYFKETTEAIKQLRQAGYTTIAIEQAKESIKLEQFIADKHQQYAVVLGHEVFGVQQEVVDMCDYCIEIPQYGTKHSLNVSVAAGIVIHHLANQLI